jgi:hypothetical protein
VAALVAKKVREAPLAVKFSSITPGVASKK